MIFKKLKIKLLPFLILCVLISSSYGCSVFMATQQPRKKNMDVLLVGTERSYVIAELGQPIWSGQKEGKQTDTFKFKQGYSKKAKIGRAVFHGTADIFSLGAWEIFGTPTELIVDGKTIQVDVSYDTKELVKSSKIIEE